MPELNNEKLDDTFYPWVTPEEKAAKQKANLLSLEHFAMLLWKDDSVVSPKESEWFGYWDENHTLIQLRN